MKKLAKEKTGVTKRQRFSPGWVIEIPIKGEYYCYAQMLPGGFLDFFDYRSFGKRIENLNILKEVPILFTTAVFRDVTASGEWPKIGKIDFREGRFPLKDFYIYHDYIDDPEFQFELYHPDTGAITRSTKEECRGLESASVWEKWAIEDRLDDYYNNRPCIWMKYKPF